MSVKCRNGDIVHVSFLDHVEDGDKPLGCHVVGRLRSKGKVIGGKRFLVVESWYFDDDVDAATAATNAKVFTILLSTVQSIETLSPFERN